MKSQKDSLEIALSDKEENMDMCPTHCIVVEVLTKQHHKKRMVILMDKEDHWNNHAHLHSQPLKTDLTSKNLFQATAQRT